MRLFDVVHRRDLSSGPAAPPYCCPAAAAHPAGTHRLTTLAEAADRPVSGTGVPPSSSEGGAPISRPFHPERPVTALSLLGPAVRTAPVQVLLRLVGHVRPTPGPTLAS